LGPSTCIVDQRILYRNGCELGRGRRLEHCRSHRIHRLDGVAARLVDFAADLRRLWTFTLVRGDPSEAARLVEAGHAVHEALVARTADGVTGTHHTDVNASLRASVTHAAVEAGVLALRPASSPCGRPGHLRPPRRMIV
jgi:hypothetical protein